MGEIVDKKCPFPGMHFETPDLGQATSATVLEPSTEFYVKETTGRTFIDV